jgi:hypothetical protein
MLAAPRPHDPVIVHNIQCILDGKNFQEYVQVGCLYSKCAQARFHENPFIGSTGITGDIQGYMNVTSEGYFINFRKEGNLYRI